MSLNNTLMVNAVLMLIEHMDHSSEKWSGSYQFFEKLQASHY